METVSKNVKGKINEMTTAFTELSAQYKHLTDQEKQSPFGVALAKSLDQLKNRVKDAKADLQSIGNELGGKVSGGAGGGMGKLGGMLSVFGGNMLTKAAGWAMNFASEIGNCVEQGIELAKAGEGIRLAFERLNRPDLLDKLREATHGTVTDLELMKQAVKFNDFKLSLDEMGTLLAFAQQKAKDTGESVNYMVDSIVTGLGRQSLMILDNLGISANEVKEKMKGTGDMTKAVAEIIRQQMSDAGDYIETAADRAAKADAEVQNAMEELGRTFQPISDAGAALWHDLKVGALDLLNSAIKPLIDNFTTLGRLRREYESAGGGTRVGGDLGKLGEHKSQQNYRILLAQYDLEIQKRERAIGAWEAWRRGDRSAGAESEVMWAKSNYGTDTAGMRAQLNAWKQMRSEFMSGAQDIFNPVVDTPVSSSDTTTKKTKKTKKTGKSTGSHKTTPAERAQQMVDSALANYAQTITEADLRMEAGLDKTIDHKKKELSAQQRLFEAYGKAYATYADPKYKTAYTEAADKYKSLAGEVKKLEDDTKRADEWLKENSKEIGGVINTGYVPSMRESILQSMAAKNIDADNNALNNLMRVVVLNGLDNINIPVNELQEQIETTGVSDKFWQELVKQINNALKDKGLDAISLDTKTGGTSKKEKTLTKAADIIGGFSGGLGQIANGVEALGIDVPKDIERMITIMQTISTILAGINTVIGVIAAIQAVKATPVIGTFLQGGGIAHAAGGLLTGHHFSGDQVPVMVNDGELILNRAQQGNVASALRNNGLADMRLEAVLDGEDIRLAVRTGDRRRGRGEYAYSKTR